MNGNGDDFRFSIAVKDGTVIVEFGTPMPCISLTPRVATNLGTLLVKRAREAAQKNGGPRYRRIKDFATYWVSEDLRSLILYLCWYDDQTEQTCRKTLQTQDLETAFAIVRGLEQRRISGNPGDLKQKPLTTVNDLLDWRAPYIESLVSAESGRAEVKRLRRLLGEKLIASLVRSDFEAFRDAAVTTENITIGTVARTLTTLRSALNRAGQDRLLRRDDIPFVPNFADKNYGRSAPPKARIVAIVELARWIDGIRDLHVLVFIIFLINTAARPGAVLGLTSEQIDLDRGVVALNPAGRIQTKKYRPVLPLTSTVLPWCQNLPPGHLITYRSKPIREIDTALIGASSRAGLPGGEGGYSVRHALARFMRAQGVPLDQISVWLGHTVPPTSPETTLTYSPDSPAYLSDAKAAVEEFVRRVNALTKADLLRPPWTE